MALVGNPIILVNRTESLLHFVADGRHYELQPGENAGFLDSHAQFAMSQNPLMGSEDYHTLAFQSLVGVKGITECRPFTDDELLASYEAIDRFDRKGSGMRPAELVRARHPRPKGRSFETTGKSNDNTIALGERA